MAAGELLVALREVRKDHHALRPLRVERLDLREGETVAIVGLDAAAAEVLVNLITGAMLPDAGEITVFGTPTRQIDDADAWFRQLDRIGTLGERVLLLDELTVEQNLALPLSLELDPLAADVRARVERLAAEVGIPAGTLRRPMGSAGPAVRARVRLGKALALDPRLLLAEHPTAALPSDDARRLAADLSDIAARRRLALLVLTADAACAAAACRHVLSWRPATGALDEASGWWAWLTRRAR